MELYTVTSTGRLIKRADGDWTEWDGSKFSEISKPLPGWTLDPRDEAVSFNDFASALRYLESLSDSNK